MIERKEDYRLTVYPIDDEEDRPVTNYIAEAITEQWGERCPDFAEGCACCEAWAQYDRLTALEQENKRLREALLKEFRINNMQSGMKREYAIVEAEHDLANLMRIKT